jgi:large subunit ribosomal protein L31
MKEGIHPKTYPVVFVDGDHTWTGISTAKTASTKMVDGVEHFVVNLEISAYSHPFYTGQKRLVDTAGRVEKFMRRYGTQMEKQNAKAAEKKK